MKSVLLLLVLLDKAGLIVKGWVIHILLQQVPGAPTPQHLPSGGERGQTGQTNAPELLSLPQNCLPDQVSPLPGTICHYPQGWRRGFLSPDGGDSPEEVPADTPGVNRKSEVAAPLHKTHVRHQDQVDGGNRLTDLRGLIIYSNCHLLTNLLGDGLSRRSSECGATWWCPWSGWGRLVSICWRSQASSARQLQTE